MVRPDQSVSVVQHHAVQVLILSVKAHLNVASEICVHGPVRLLNLVPQQAGHALHLDLLLPDEDLQTE